LGDHTQMLAATRRQSFAEVTAALNASDVSPVPDPAAKKRMQYTTFVSADISADISLPRGYLTRIYPQKYPRIYPRGYILFFWGYIPLEDISADISPKVGCFRFFSTHHHLALPWGSNLSVAFVTYNIDPVCM
jgi:hypothetical protein